MHACLRAPAQVDGFAGGSRLKSPLETCPRENGEGGEGVVNNSHSKKNHNPLNPPFLPGGLEEIPLNKAGEEVVFHRHSPCI